MLRVETLEVRINTSDQAAMAEDVAEDADLRERLISAYVSHKNELIALHMRLYCVATNQACRLVRGA